METTKRLFRSKENKIVAGVCGGISEHFQVDPVWIRLAMILLTLVNGIGVVLYILAWILIPENPKQKKTKKTVAEEAVESIKTGKHVKKEKKGHFLLGLIILIVGLGLLLQNLFSWFSFNYVWPITIIVLGLYLIKGGSK